MIGLGSDKNYNDNTKDIEYLQLQLCFLFQDVIDITGVGALAALEISLKNDPYNQDNKPKNLHATCSNACLKSI